MSLSTGDRERLTELLHALRYGRPLGDEAAWLHKIVVEDAEARQLYVDSLWLTGAMSWLLKGFHAGDQLAAVISTPSPAQSAVEGSAAFCELAESAEGPVAPPPTRQFAPSSPSPTVPSSHRTPVLGFLAPLARGVPGGEATVGGLIVLVLVAAFWGLAQKILHPNLGDRELAVGTGMRDEGSEIRDQKRKI